MLHILGIRHHGTGSAKRVLQRLEEIRPDLVLVEGPPEFDSLLKWVRPDLMQPPVAILGFDEDAAHKASFYPFAAFSPEWQAITYANTHKILVRMIDLPLQTTLELARQGLHEPSPNAVPPMTYLAQLEGYTDSEAWWEHRFEEHHSDIAASQYFEAVLLAMTALREAGIASALDGENRFREAWMRNIMRAAQKEMFEEIVVVCGAWHAPALLNIGQKEKADKALLQQLPKSKIKIAATWVPWTNERLALRSGYGAGVHTPGWSEHRWQYPENTGAEWLAIIAQKFREKRIDISTAHVLEALRLAETLAAMRGLSAPTLPEYDEATATVMCMGNEVQLDWLRKELVVGNRIGKVPDKLPKLPIQKDFEQKIKYFRLRLSDTETELRLDLRAARDLEKSIFLHQLVALQVNWGDVSQPDGAKGTFHEIWSLRWRPEMELELITRGTWGNTVEEAAAQWVLHRTHTSQDLAELTQLLAQSMLGALYDVIGEVLRHLGNVAARSTHVFDLMAAVPASARAMRYGNVRQTDRQAIEMLLDGLVRRICVGLAHAGYGLDDDTAKAAFEAMASTHDALQTTERPDWLDLWLDALGRLQPQSHPLLLGYATRLRFGTGRLSAIHTAQLFGQALSIGQEPTHSAAWLEGFLRGSAGVLLYDSVLWNLVHGWVTSLPYEDFRGLMPILRRTFAQYEPAERRKLGEKAKQGILAVPQASNDTPVMIQEGAIDFDVEVAQRVAGVVRGWLG
jgi:hypothetical protein